VDGGVAPVLGSMQVSVNGSVREVPDELSLAQLLELLELPSSGIAVALNGDVVPRKRHREVRLGAEDRIEIVRAVQGG